MPKNRNFNLSVWLILYSKPLYLKCMRWINSRICCDCYTKINLFFTVLNYGPKRLVGPAVLRKPETCIWSMYAEITFWRQTSHHLRGNDSREAVPCTSDSASQEPQPQLPDSALTDLNSLPSPDGNNRDNPAWTIICKYKELDM